MSKEKPKHSYWILHLIILFVVIAVVWYCSYLVILDRFNDWNERGVFGDSFGAVNSLFSGLAFAGIIYTIILQRKEFELQRLELIKSVEAQENLVKN